MKLNIPDNGYALKEFLKRTEIYTGIEQLPKIDVFNEDVLVGSTEYSLDAEVEHIWHIAFPIMRVLQKTKKEMSGPEIWNGLKKLFPTMFITHGEFIPYITGWDEIGTNLPVSVDSDNGHPKYKIRNIRPYHVELY